MDTRSEVDRESGAAQLSPRDVLKTGGLLALGGVGAATVAGYTSSSRSAAPEGTATTDAAVGTTAIRLATVGTNHDGGGSWLSSSPRSRRRRATVFRSTLPTTCT